MTTVKMPILFTALSITVYSFICLYIASNTSAGALVNTLVFLITMPFVGMVAFALSATFCAIFCKRHKKEINKCHEAIRESVKKVIDINRVKSGTIEVSDINYQICSYKKEGLR